MAGLVTTTEFIELVKPLDDYEFHPLHGEALDRVYRTYRSEGYEQAASLVTILKGLFRDLRADSYLSGVAA